MSSEEVYKFLQRQYSTQYTNSYSYFEREKAWQLFEQVGFLPPKSENYRFAYSQIFKNAFENELQVDKKDCSTNLDFHLSVGARGDNEEINFKEIFYKIDAYHLVILDGDVAFALSSLEGAEDFFSVFVGRNAFCQQSATYPSSEGCNPAQNISIKSNFEKKSLTDSFLLINNALYKNDIFIQIKQSAIPKKPIIIYVVYTSKADAIAHCRIHVEACEGSNSQIIFSTHYNPNEEKGTSSQNFQRFINLQNTIHLQQNAHMNFYTIQANNFFDLCAILNNTSCVLGKNSRFESFTVSKTNMVVRNNLNVFLDEEQSHAALYGLAMPYENGFIDNHTAVYHNVAHTSSDELYRNVVIDSAEAVFNGEIFVNKDAQKTQAFQANDSLLLSENATVHTKPQLEIFADDVKCSHGATIGQLDMEKIYYLRTRGISEEIAREILVDSFTHAVLQKISNTEIQEIIKVIL